MHAISTLLFLIFSLGTALPTSIPQENCTSTPPQTFTIAGFTTFTPAPGNPHPASVFFQYTSDFTTRTSCFSSGSSNSSVACLNPAVNFTYTEGILTVVESHVNCDSAAPEANITVTGTLGLSTFCYPSQPPQPNGFGTQCQTPTDQLSGSFA